MKCPRCLNEDPRYFYQGSRGWYCRRCISFGRAILEEDRDPISLMEIQGGSEEYTLSYPLTDAQKEIGKQVAQLIDNHDVLIQAVCGAGKTEMVVPLISKCLKSKKKICFAIARRQVVLELSQRITQYFPFAKVIAVCGGHTEELDGDLIICTTHQLYRYYQAFDVLIVDEPDAFPFKGSATLHGIASTSCRGHCVYLTATPDDALKKRIKEKDIELLRLNQRPHGQVLPVPVVKIGTRLSCYVRLFHWIRRHTIYPKIIFVPTIHEAERLSRLLSLFWECYCCTSKTQDRDQIIDAYRSQEDGLIVATTVLERGVTIPKADVCVLFADHQVFDMAGLVQMAGRVGRSFERPDGDVLFLSRENSRVVNMSVQAIVEANRWCA